jgi:adenosylhomocysteine nucleosidase
MKILVTFAVAAEFAAWRKHHDFRQIARQPYPLFAADIGGSTVRVVLTGMGAASASQAVRWALASASDLCVSSGFAGGLRPDLRVREVLAARVVLRAEEELAVASDRDLLAAARDAGARQVDRFLTSERLITTAAEKRSLAQEADAVEMESFVILAEAARHGVRAVAVRAASDAAETSLAYDFARARDERGQIRISALLPMVFAKPSGIPALLRLARDSRAAARDLAEFLDRYLALLHARLDLSHSEMVAAL